MKASLQRNRCLRLPAKCAHLGLLLVVCLVAYVLLQVVLFGTSGSKQQEASLDLPGQPSPVVENMLSWIRGHYGIVNVAVREVPGLGRITVAPHDIAAGDILAAIPKTVCFDATARTSEVESALKLWRELQNQASPLAPYLKALPSSSQVFSYYSMPESYLTLIQNTAMVTAIKQVQQQLQHLSPGAGADPPSINSTSLQYMMSLLKTRAFDCGELGQLLVPVIDLANHHNHCPHNITSYKNCGPEAPGGCVVWRAGVDVPAGHEVCNSYHTFMLQDRSILQYGMLQKGAPAHMLSGIDRHDFNPQQPWAFQADSNMEPFAGSHKEMQAEASRLGKLLSDMHSLDRSVQVAPDPVVDPQGEVLHNLQLWRAERRAAIEAEHTRLVRLLHQAPAAAVHSDRGADAIS